MAFCAPIQLLQVGRSDALGQEAGKGAGARAAPRQAPAAKHSRRDAGPREGLGKFSSTWLCFSNRKQAGGQNEQGQEKGSRLEEFQAFRPGRGAPWARDPHHSRLLRSSSKSNSQVSSGRGGARQKQARELKCMHGSDFNGGPRGPGDVRRK